MPILYPVVEEWVARGNQLAHELHRSAEYERAEVQYRALLPWATRKQRATLLNNLAMLLRDNGRLNEALPMMEESLKIRRELEGEMHPETLLALSNLASLRGAMGDWKQAGRIFRQVLSERQKTGERPDLGLADTLVNVALIEKLEGRFLDSLAHLEQALDLLPPGSTRSLATIHNNMATSLMTIGRSKEARPHLMTALGQVEAAHPMRAQILQSLALLELSQGRYSEARIIVEEATRIETRVFPTDHPRHTGREKLLAWIEFGEGNWKQAEARLSKIDGEEMDILELRARIALKRKNERGALALLERAMAMGRDQGTVMRGVLTLFAELMRKQDRFAEAAKAEQQLITLETRSALASYRASSR